jgi:hypothetical protein
MEKSPFLSKRFLVRPPDYTIAAFSAETSFSFTLQKQQTGCGSATSRSATGLVSASSNASTVTT